MITIKQMAIKKGLSKTRVQKLITQKRITAKRIGNQWVILSEKIKPALLKGRPKKINKNGITK